MENPSNITSNQSNLSPCPLPSTSVLTPTPVPGPYHRRTRSEFQFCLTEDLPEDLDCGESFGGVDELVSQDDLFNLDIEILGSESRVDSAGAAVPGSDNLFPSENGGGEAGNSRTTHRRSVSVGSSSADAMKAMDREKLAQLWRDDPKKAKRIVANRESAARSKKRKALYFKELQKRVETLQTEAITLSIQMSLCQSNTNDLLSENENLKIRIKAMEEKAQIRNALHEKLRKQIDELKFAIGEASSADASNLRMANMQYQQHQQQFLFGHHQQQNAQNLQQMPYQFDLFQPNSSQNMNTSYRPNPSTNHQQQNAQNLQVQQMPHPFDLFQPSHNQNINTSYRPNPSTNHQQQNAQNLQVQQMPHPFDLFQPNHNQKMNTSYRPNPSTNHQLMHHAASNFPAQSHSYSEVIHEDPLGQLQGLDISSCGRGSNFGRSDIKTENSSTM